MFAVRGLLTLNTLALLSSCVGLLHDDFLDKAGLDVDPPVAVSAISIYSDLVGGVSTTATYSPDFWFDYAGDAQGSGLAGFEARAVGHPSGAAVSDWEFVSENPWGRASKLQLQNGGQYKIEVRAVDKAGNASEGVLSPVFTVQELTHGTPFDGVSLAQVETLPDLAVGNTTILNSLRTAPTQAKNLRLFGEVSWNESGTTSLFFRAKTLSLENALIRADGQTTSVSGPVQGTGGRGGSGGGGGATNSSGDPAGNGGSAGASGGVSGGFGSWPGGVGTASTYNTGFVYGNGGAGSDSFGPGFGTGASGGNAAGGGGGGSTGPSGGGGGGGGGLIVLVADEILGSARLSARGGHATKVTPGQLWAGKGGGGVVWIAARAFNASLEIDVNGGAYLQQIHTAIGAPGSAGSFRFFQINSDNTLTERRLSDRFDEDGILEIPELQTTLTLPFLIEDLPDTDSTADTVWTGPVTIDTMWQSRLRPLMAKTLSVSGSVTWNVAQNAGYFLYVNALSLSAAAVIDADGQPGSASGAGSNGGRGASGGGAGANGAGIMGGNGGSGTDGTAVDISVAGGGSMCPILREGFEYGLGGNGGNGGSFTATTGRGGAGVNACGGGGGGAGNNGAGAGGGGAGLIVVVANSITGTGTLRARGGAGFGGGGTTHGGAGGGGGVIWVATKSYSGGITANVNGGSGGTGTATNGGSGTAGTAKIFQILDDGTLLERSFSDSW